LKIYQAIYLFYSNLQNFIFVLILIFVLFFLYGSWNRFIFAVHGFIVLMQLLEK